MIRHAIQSSGDHKTNRQNDLARNLAPSWHFAMVALAALALSTACSRPDVAGPSPALASEAARRVATDSQGRLGAASQCSGTWLRLPHPNELTYELDEWTVFLLADRHDPNTLPFAIVQTGGGPIPGAPALWVGAGPQSQGPVVAVRVGSYGRPIAVRVTAGARRDCSALDLSFPFDHSGGQ